MAGQPLRSVVDGEHKPAGKVGKWSGHPWMWRGVSLASTVFFPFLVILVTPLIAKLFGVNAFGGLVVLAEIKNDPWIFAVVLGQVVVMSFWYWANIRVVQNMETTVNELKTEVNVSVWMAILVALAAGWMVGAYGSVYWSFIVPAIAQILDGPGSAGTSINNAAQKPLMQRA